ncbi:hypothetical protein BO221_44115 [Archangium sp. Cb G35]|uniref:hypothetical protein n=1 Tax=Archangium sp. Cb G35 TaxID=1920190 RepID=UPI0009375FB0|nr:hypothetical protein [Archangium sp. Cb G35]OJT17562.1 hypothetical protein BO221_44115 [Archangium sp. Cb G35]
MLLICRTCGHKQTQTNALVQIRRCPDCGTDGLVLASHSLSAGPQERRQHLTSAVASRVDWSDQPGFTTCYSQNPNQSGDTTGVAVSLLLFPNSALAFFVSSDEVSKAEGFLKFYASIGVSPQRLILVVGDASAESREAMQKLEQTLDSQQVNIDKRAYNVEKRRAEIEQEMREAVEEARNEHGDTEAEEVEKSLRKKGVGARTKKFEEVRNQLEQRFALNAAKDTRLRDKLAAYEDARTRYGQRVSTVVLWDGLMEMSGNQMYIAVNNPGMRLTRQSTTERAFREVLGGLNLTTIGQTTRHIQAEIERSGPDVVARKVRDVARLGMQRHGEIAGFVNRFADKLALASKSRGGKRGTVVLIWSRGLNGDEMKRLKQAGIQPAQVTEANWKKIDAAKRNPHHVMTAQLYESICLAVRRAGQDQAGRPLIPVVIGDELRVDWYEQDPGRAQDNLWQGEQDDNLIHFFKRLSCFAGDRHSQMAFLLALLSEFDVIQIGIRSGGLEAGMYMGIPTIYLEEKDCKSGGERMASVSQTVSLPLKPLPTKSMPFFRLQTAFPVGLNQARTRQNVKTFLSDLEQRELVESQPVITPGPGPKNAVVVRQRGREITKGYYSALKAGRPKYRPQSETRVLRGGLLWEEILTLEELFKAIVKSPLCQKLWRSP